MEVNSLKFDEWLKIFKKHVSKKLFSLSDLVVLTDEDKSSLSVQLSRLVKSNIVNRIARDWYENPFNSPSSEEVSMVLRHPCYLSMEYALFKLDILSQRAYTLTMITTKFPYIYKTVNAIYEYHQIKKSLFWGFKKSGTVAIAEPEKALLDLIYIRYSRNKDITIDRLYSLIDDMDIEELNQKKLFKYVRSFDSRTQKVLLNIFKKNNKIIIG